MYCPVCRDEFRPGFTRCRACDVDLVDSLEVPAVAAPQAPVHVEARASVAPRPARPTNEVAVNFCGFLVLDEARQAKRQLRERDIESEILIKDAADGREEFWLRVKPSDVRAVQDLLGYDETQSEEGDTVLCAACENLVTADGEHCPQCGARFEED